MSNIILIGMPGSGKSTCGVLAAKALCKSFLDTDLLLQQAEGAPLQEIINTKGTDYFNAAEAKCLETLCAENTVIATGGSAVYHEKAMVHLKALGTVVYLKISVAEMKARIKNITTRGIVLHRGETLEQLYEERVPLYESYADVTIDCDNLEVEQTVEKILVYLPKADKQE